MKNFKSLAAFTAASMISLASVATPIFAADATVSFPTSVHTPDGHITADESNITYTITAKNVGKEWNDHEPADVHFNGVNGVKFTVTPSRKNDDAATSDVIEYGNAQISCDNVNAFPGAGVFVYQLEVATTGNEKGNKGITPGEEVYEMQVFVVYNDGELEVNSYAFANAEGEKLNAKNLVFSNIYDPSELTVRKEIAGNQADPNQEFNFTLTINSQVHGKTYTVNGETVTTDENGTATHIFKLKGGQSVLVDGLTEEDSYTLKEDEAGYLPAYSYTVGTAAAQTGNVNTLTQTASTFESEEVVFTNTKNGTVPTGILMTAAPYVAVVGLGGVFAGMFFRRKRED